MLLKFFEDNWGSVVSVLGFAITIWTLVRTKSVAMAARDAARDTRTRMMHIDSVADCTLAISMMEEIKRLHRAGVWAVLPDRYSAVQRLIRSIHTNTNELTESEKEGLTGAITQFRLMEEKVEKAGLGSQLATLDHVRLNTITSKQIDQLDRVRNLLRQKEG